MKRKEIDIEKIKELYSKGNSDREIGELLGLNRKLIGKLRREAGIRANLNKTYRPEYLPLIKKMLEKGRSGTYICRYLKLPHYKITRLKREYNLSSKYDTKMTKEDIEKAMELAKQGKMDSEIAKLYNVSVGEIFYLRKTRGIKSQFDYSKISKIDNTKFEKLFNQGLSDYKIAEELGMSSDGVYSHRMRHGYLRDKLTENKEIPLNSYQLQVLIGTVLGDSSLRKCTKNSNISFSCAHCDKQTELLNIKRNIFCNMNPIIFNSDRKDKRTHKWYYSNTLRLGANPAFNSIYNSFYSTGKKIIPMDLMKYFTRVSLAFMFMDDGSKTKCGYSIATNCFSIENIQEFQKFLYNKWGLNTSIYKSSNVLYIKSSSKDLFTNLVKPYICNSMKYKLH